MVVVVQILGASEKLWITVWGEAYPKLGNATSSSFFSFMPASSMPDNEALPFGFSPHHHYHQTAFHSLADVDRSTVGGSFGYEWPDASAHPYFYVGVYGAIGFAIAFANILSVTAQYTAALRASRILFKWVLFKLVSPVTFPHRINRRLLVTVVRATFRFHDTTPQGKQAAPSQTLEVWTLTPFLT